MTREELREKMAHLFRTVYATEADRRMAADAAISLIRAEVLEETARVAEKLAGTVKRGNIAEAMYIPPTAKDAAAAIRALKEKP